MFYDILKVLKKCLKMWYVFLLTLVVGVSATFLIAKPLRKYNSSFNIKTEYLNRKILWDEFYSWDVYDEKKQNVTTAVANNYFKDNVDEIKKNLSITDENIRFSVDISISGSYSVLSVYVQSNDNEVCKKVIDYVNEDIVSYLEAKIDEKVESKYLLPTINNTVSNPTEISITINRRLILGFIFTILLLIIELFVIGFIALCKKTIEVDSDLNSNFDVKILVKDYESKLKALETILKKNKAFKENVLVISDDVDYVSNKIKFEKLKYKDLKSVLEIENFCDIKETAFIIEIVKGKTLKKDIEKLTNALNSLNFTDICFITRKEMKSNESSSSK